VVVELVCDYLGSTKGSLHSVNVRNLEHTPQSDARSRLLVPLDLEAGEVVREVVGREFGDNKGKDARLFWNLHVGVTIHENVFASRVTVEITVEGERPLVGELLGHVLQVPDRGVQVLVWPFVPSVQVASSQGTPVVSVDHTIGIEHGDDLEDVVLPQDLCLDLIGNEEVDHTLHHPRPVRLPGVHSCCDNHALFLSCRF